MKKEIQEMKKNGWFPILKTGTFKDDQNQEHTFTEDDLKTIADNYDPEDKANFKEAALTIGHPKNNSPAFGWVEKLKQAGNMLFAKPADMVPEFVEAVKKKMYKYISPAIRPDKTLKHVGFIGGQPPAIPGLGPVSEVFSSFSEDDEAIELSFDFAELDEWKVENRLLDLGRLFQNIREFIIDKFSLEDANKTIPGYEVSHLQRVSVLKDDPERFANYSENNNKKEVDMPISKEDLDSAVAKKEQEVTSQFSERVDTEKERADKAEVKLAKKELETKTEFVANFVERVKSEGKIFPNEVEGVTNLIMRQDDSEAFNFSEGSEKETNQKFIMNFIDGLQGRIPLGKLKVKGEGETDRSSDFSETNVSDESLELRNKAMALSKKEGIPFDDAIERVR